jgi:5-methylcytosine-specific restriction endonuclease McrA
MNLEERREYHRQYYRTHAETIKARTYIWACAHPDSVKAAIRRWRKANPDKTRAATSRYRQNHPEKAREAVDSYQKANTALIKLRQQELHKKNPEKRRAIDRKYQISHPDIFRAKSSRRRAKKRGVKEFFTAEQRQKVMLQFGYSCFSCGYKESPCLDHHLPLSAGHPLEFGNAVILCRSCNAKKRNKLPSEFYTPEQLIRLNTLLEEQRGWLS